MSRRSAVIVLLSLAALVVTVAPAGAGGTTPKIGAPHLVGSTLSINSGPVMACPPGKAVSATTCYLVGDGPGGKPPGGGTPFPPNDYRAELIPVHNGKPGHAVAFPKAESGADIACGSASSCEVAGYATTYAKAAVIPLSKGKLGKPRIVAGYDGWSGITCPTATSCLAVGLWRKSSASLTEKGLVVVIKKGKATEHLVSVAGEFDSVSCLSATTCLVVGQTPNAQAGVYAWVRSGRVGKAHVVTKAFSGLRGVACGWAKSSCVALSDVSGGSGISPARVVIRGSKLSFTKLSAASPIASFTCPATGHCLGFGVVKPNSPGQHGVVAIVTKAKIGAWKSVSKVGNVEWLACSKANSCVGIGSSLTGSYPGNIQRTFAVT